MLLGVLSTGETQAAMRTATELPHVTPSTSLPSQHLLDPQPAEPSLLQEAAFLGAPQHSLLWLSEHSTALTGVQT